MRTALLTLASITLLSLGLAPARAGSEPPVGNERLRERMEAMKDNLKQTAIVVRTPGSSLDDALDHVVELQRHVVETKAMTPARVDRLEGPQRDAELRAYRRQQAELLIELANLELALLDDDRDGAWKIIAGPLFEKRERGHDRFQDPEDEG